MTDAPSRVLITGGHEVGGVGSVAAGLVNGFGALGIPAEIVPASAILSRWRDLRDSSILKILSTSAVHGVPCVDVQGWATMSSIIVSFKLANACGAQLVSVSEYTAVHLQNLFNVRIDAVIHNPLKPLYLVPPCENEERKYITYLGRLVPAKNLHRLLPAICDLLDECSDLQGCIVGDGPLRAQLQASVQQHPRVEFKGCLSDPEVRACLRKTKVFVSGNCTEGLGVTYLEALSQGCIVAMPASGGGLELALDSIRHNIHLLPLSLDRGEVVKVLRTAASVDTPPVSLAAYRPEEVAAAYLKLDSLRFEPALTSFADRRVLG
jgi:glycosyltransferase involved in cell wall biosynthesis